MNVKLRKLHPSATIPKYGTTGAAAFDLAAPEAGLVVKGITTLVGTGLAFEIPEGYVMLIAPRSGMGLRGISLKNTVGVIDSDYRGEVMVPVWYRPELHGDDWYEWSAGERIAQALIVPAVQVTFEEVDSLSTTDRGAGGFGSTGVK